MKFNLKQYTLLVNINTLFPENKCVILFIKNLLLLFWGLQIDISSNNINIKCRVGESGEKS